MTTTTAPRFRVALSFPGEKRHFVEKVARSLALYLREERVLYDAWDEIQAELARADLGFHLPELYRSETELAIAFACDEYDKKLWCKIEWRLIHDHIFLDDPERVMLLRVDSETATLPGLSDSAGFKRVDSNDDTPAALTAAILHRLHLLPDDQLALFLDRLLHDVEISSIIQQVLGDRSVAPTCGCDAIALLRTRKAMRADFFEQLRIHLRDEDPDIAPGVDLIAEIDALEGRLKLDPVDRRPRPVPTPPSSTPKRTNASSARPPSHLSLVIDRTRQWLKFKEKCSQKRGDHIFVVHGKHDQDLHLFLERILRFFDDGDDGAGLVTHELIVVDLEQGGARPTDVDAWEALVRQRINETIGVESTSLPKALNELCRDNAAILVLVGQGGGGLIANPRPGLAPLDVAETRAFVDFVAGFHKYLGKSRRRPVRLVVPVEYADRRTDPLWLGLDPHVDESCFVVLDELTYPSWSEVEGTLREYMKRHFGRTNTQIRDLCEAEYHRLSKDPEHRSFAALGQALSDLLARYHVLPEPPPARGRH